MNTNEIYKTTSPVRMTILSDGDTDGSMILPTGTVLRVESFEPADPSVGIVFEGITFEVGTLIDDCARCFTGVGIYVEQVGNLSDLFGWTDFDTEALTVTTVAGTLEPVA